ncbi:MAG: recombination protein RecR, partial [Bdellovibrionales bacterium]|nr:recombination protein RecR [Bdellovibrionales bacterium]
MSIYSYPRSMRRLINELSKLPSVGSKTAARLAYHLVLPENADAIQLAEAIREAREKIRHCSQCFAFAEDALCSICADSGRDRSLLCVVEKPADVMTLERSGGYHGRYHVLHGLWSPLKGVRADAVKIDE